MKRFAKVSLLCLLILIFTCSLAACTKEIKSKKGESVTMLVSDIAEPMRTTSVTAEGNSLPEFNTNTSIYSSNLRGVSVVRKYENGGYLYGLYDLFNEKYLLTPGYSQPSVVSGNVYVYSFAKSISTFTIIAEDGRVFINNVYCLSTPTVSVSGTYVSISYTTDSETVTKKYYYSIKDNAIVWEENKESTELSVGDSLKNLYNDAAEIGLDGYFYREDTSGYGKFFEIYNDNGSLVNRIKIPSSATGYWTINGNLFYVSIIQVPDNSSNYDVSLEGAKFQYEYKRIDLLTGKSKNVKDTRNSSFVVIGVQEGNVIRDENDKITHIIASVFLKKNKVLSEHYTVLLNDKGTIACDLTSYNFNTSYVYKTANGFLSMDNNGNYFLTDENFTKTVDLKGYSNISYDEHFVYMSNSNNKYGAIDYSGKVILPFEFDSSLSATSNRFVNNAKRVYNSTENKSYIFKTNGQLTLIEQNPRAVYLAISTL